MGFSFKFATSGNDYATLKKESDKFTHDKHYCCMNFKLCDYAENVNGNYEGSFNCQATAKEKLLAGCKATW